MHMYQSTRPGCPARSELGNQVCVWGDFWGNSSLLLSPKPILAQAFRGVFVGGNHCLCLGADLQSLPSAESQDCLLAPFCEVSQTCEIAHSQHTFLPAALAPESVPTRPVRALLGERGVHRHHGTPHFAELPRSGRFLRHQSEHGVAPQEARQQSQQVAPRHLPRHYG